MFELNITLPVIISAAVLLVAVLWLLIGWCSYVRSVRARVVADSETPVPEGPEAYPQVSIVVYSEDDAENLEVLLPALLTQDYPEQFEVIVVNDGAVSSTKDVISRMEQIYSNLYMTFTPLDSRSLSRKKLAVTLGIKAARFEVIVHLTGDCRVTSDQWLRHIGRHFGDGKELVIGYAYPVGTDGDETPHPNRRLHAFSQVRTAVEYLSWAIAGRPYRGDSHNLAYRRSIFFRSKGFSKSLNLKYGDDDVFVNEVATGENTAVELSADSMVQVVSNNPAAMHRHDKLRYGFTGRLIRRSALTFFATCSWMWWLAIGATVAMSLFGLPSLIPMIAGVVILLSTWICMAVAWRGTALSLCSTAACLTFPWFMSIHPLYTLIYWWRGWRTRKSNYTWQ
ncbi:MAG: glycosyltransferase [Duncaniella sp.]|nr:glycosyltransferase [Duncaniella sp.]